MLNRVEAKSTIDPKHFADLVRQKVFYDYPKKLFTAKFVLLKRKRSSLPAETWRKLRKMQQNRHHARMARGIAPPLCINK